MVLGNRIRDARARSGLSIEEVSKRTKIRVSLLREFEDDNFKNAGGAAYVRGHLRNIANVLGVDAAALISAFDSEHVYEHRSIHQQLVENNAAQPTHERKQIKNSQLIIGSVIVIALILFGSLLVNTFKNTASAPKASPKPSVVPTQSATPTPAPTPSGVVSTYSSGAGVTVSLLADTGSSWLFVTDADNVTLFSGRAFQGSQYVFTSSKTINLRIGNAGAVKLTVNGHAVAPLGTNGEVINVSYGVNS